MADTKITKSPRFMDMTPDELRAAYWAQRESNYRWSQLAQPRRQDGGRSAGGMGRGLRALDLIVNVARKRGVNLLEAPMI